MRLTDPAVPRQDDSRGRLHDHHGNEPQDSLNAEQAGYKQSLGSRHVPMIAIGGFSAMLTERSVGPRVVGRVVESVSRPVNTYAFWARAAPGRAAAVTAFVDDVER